MGVSIFQVAGPIMIGPSSSHTAGAARLGRIAAKLAERI
jgi:L-serine dehydratase